MEHIFGADNCLVETDGCDGCTNNCFGCTGTCSKTCQGDQEASCVIC